MPIPLLSLREQGMSVGEILAKHLEQTGMSQKELATRTGLTPKHINRIVKGKAAFSAKTALKLERATGVVAWFWLECQGEDLLKQARELADDPEPDYGGVHNASV
jgi:HTH-type transcriptional regulator/antitoxin HigA